jgi:hypothetical protein
MIDQPHTTNANDLIDLEARRGAYKRPRARKLQPNDRVQRSAAQLLGLGIPVTVAVSHLFEQLDAIGYPSTARQGPTKLHDQPDPANPDLDTTGDSACHAYELGKMKEDLRDAIGDIEKRINALARLVVKITNDPLPGSTVAKVLRNGATRHAWRSLPSLGYALATINESGNGVSMPTSPTDPSRPHDVPKRNYAYALAFHRMREYGKT